MFLIPYFESQYFNEYFIRAIPNTGIFKINNIDRTEYLVAGSYNINESLNNRNSATWKMIIKNPINVEFRPKVGQEISFDSRLCKGGKYEREFGGVITSVSYKQSSCGSFLKLDCNAADFNHTLDRRLVYNIYQPMQCFDLILDIVQKYLAGEGITTEGVVIPPIDMPKFVVPYLTVANTFDEISKATGLFYYVDYFKVLHFFLRSETQADFNVTSVCDSGNRATFCAVIADANDCIIGGIRFGDISVRETDSKLTNQQFVVAGQGETKNLVEVNFAGDGVTTSFVLPYKLSSCEEVEEATVSVAFADRDSEDTNAHWYFTKGENQIGQNTTFPPLGLGVILTIRFYGFYQVLAAPVDAPSQAYMKSIMGQGTGIYQNLHEDSNIESQDYANFYAKGLLKRNRAVPVFLEFTTDRYRPRTGQLFSAYLPEYGVKKLSTGSDFLVESVDIENIQGSFNRYKITATSEGYQGGWQDFYKKLEKAGISPKLSKESEIGFIFTNLEQTCIELTLTVGDITDLKPFCPCYDPKLNVGCGRVGNWKIGIPKYKAWQ